MKKAKDTYREYRCRLCQNQKNDSGERIYKIYSSIYNHIRLSHQGVEKQDIKNEIISNGQQKKGRPSKKFVEGLQKKIKMQSEEEISQTEEEEDGQNTRSYVQSILEKTSMNFNYNFSNQNQGEQVKPYPNNDVDSLLHVHQFHQDDIIYNQNLNLDGIIGHSDIMEEDDDVQQIGEVKGEEGQGLQSILRQNNNFSNIHLKNSLQGITQNQFNTHKQIINYQGDIVKPFKGKGNCQQLLNNQNTNSHFDFQMPISGPLDFKHPESFMAAINAQNFKHKPEKAQCTCQCSVCPKMIQSVHEQLKRLEEQYTNIDNQLKILQMAFCSKFT